jgi:hypothetical protein
MEEGYLRFESLGQFNYLGENFRRNFRPVQRN